MMNIIKKNKNYAGIYKNLFRYKYRSEAYETKEVDLLQRSIVPMNHFQRSILKLPVPKLTDTLSRYQLSQEAILDESSFLKTKRVIDSFSKDEGPNLNKDLYHFVKTNKHTNYVNVLWTDMYLKDRRPVVLTHNPTIVFKNPKKNSNLCTQEIRAANMIFSSIRFIRSLQASLLEPAWFHKNDEKTNNEKFRKLIRRVPSLMSAYVAYFMKVYPLDMSQLKHLISTTRIPRPNKDEIMKFEDSRHILVLHKGQMYTFDILKTDGRGVDPKQVMSNVRFILNQPATGSHLEPGLGLLTTMDRDKWAAAREQLVQSGNKEALQRIDSSLFAVALDSSSYKTDVEMMENTLHGSAENRWFDKSFTVIIDAKGDAAINFEHSWGDGIAVMRYFNEVYEDSELNPQFEKPISSSEETSLPPPRVDRITFHLNTRMTSEILPQAKKEYDEKRGLLEWNLADFQGFGEANLKGTKLGSDSIMQLCFQMAHYKMKGRQAATYESVTTASFKDGRTETLRPATMETRKFCEMLSKGSFSNLELFEGLLNCSKKHNKLTIEGLMGQGWDRHLFGLRHFAEKKGQVPEIFTDPNYGNINNIVISTSTVPSDYIEFGGFAAVIRDGYGLGYGIKENVCGAVITSWKDSSDSNGSQFKDALVESFKQVAQIIDLQKSKATSP